MNRAIQTKDRILDAAEKLFAERGYAATSLRSIIVAAGVNLAAVHYHFHTKEALLEAVLLRRAEPSNTERLQLLAEYEQQSAPQAAALEKVIEAFLLPTFRLTEAHGGRTFLRLMGRLHAESDLLPRLVLTRFGPVLECFAEALRRAVPEVPPQELFWRGYLAIGATAQVLRGYPAWPGGADGAPDWEQVLPRLVSYLSAGFRARVQMAQAQEMK